MEPINNEQKYRKTTATTNNKTPNTHAGNCRTCLCHNFKLLSHAQRQTDKMRQTTTTATTTATATRDIRAKIQIQIRRYFRCIGTQQQPFFSREEELNLRFLHLPEGKFESEMKGFCRQFFFHPIIFLAGLSLIPFLVISFDLAMYYPFLLSFLPFKACFSNHSSSNTFR